MPGFAGALSSEARWDLIDYVRAHNAGESLRTTGVWQHPVPVPQFDATCGDGRTVDLDDLRGRVLRIVAVADAKALAALPPGGRGVTTVILARTPLVVVDSAMCVANEPETWTAFAILSGVPDDGLAGVQMLVDLNGWLRAAWRPDGPEDWMNREVLAAVVAGIVARPIAADAVGGHMHHH
jgi:hypothetical protein